MSMIDVLYDKQIADDLAAVRSELTELASTGNEQLVQRLMQIESRLSDKLIRAQQVIDNFNIESQRMMQKNIDPDKFRRSVNRVIEENKAALTELAKY
jgi:hypothetical protein